MQKSFETVNCVGLVPVSETVSNPVGDTPVLLTEKVCGELVASMGVEANPKVVGAMARATGTAVVLVVVVLVLAVVVDAGVVDVVWVVVEIVLVVAIVVLVVELVVLVVGSVIGLLGHSPSIAGARSRNAFASSRAMRLSGPNSTWYVSPPPRITRRRHALVTGFGGTTVIAPPSPRAFALMRKTRPLAPARRTSRTGPFKPPGSLYMKPVVPLALHPLAGRKKSSLVDVAPTAKKVSTAPAVIGSPTIVSSLDTSLPTARRRRCVDALFTRALRPRTVWSAARAFDDSSMVSAIRILDICLIASAAALLQEQSVRTPQRLRAPASSCQGKSTADGIGALRRSRRAAFRRSTATRPREVRAWLHERPTTRGQFTTAAGAKTIEVKATRCGAARPADAGRGAACDHRPDDERRGRLLGRGRRRRASIRVPQRRCDGACDASDADGDQPGGGSSAESG